MIIARIPKHIPCSPLWSFRKAMEVSLQNTSLSGHRPKHFGKGQESQRDNSCFGQICNSCILCHLVIQNIDGMIHSDMKMDGLMRKKIKLGPWQPRSWRLSMLLLLAWAHMNAQLPHRMPTQLWNITYLHLLLMPSLSSQCHPLLICTLWKFRPSQPGMMVWMQMRNWAGIGVKCRRFKESQKLNW